MNAEDRAEAAYFAGSEARCANAPWTASRVIASLLAENAELRAENERMQSLLPQIHEGYAAGRALLRTARAERDAAEAELAEVRAKLAAAREIEDRLFTALLAAGQSAWPDMMPALVGEARKLSIELHAALASAPTDQASDEAKCKHGNSSAHWVPNPVFGSCGEGSWCRPAVQHVEAPTEEKQR